MILESQNLTDDAFTASKVWLHCFIRRAGVSSMNLHGEARGVYITDIKETMPNFCSTFNKYEHDQIYKQDEGVLVFQFWPNVSYLVPEESRKEPRGVKTMTEKRRITFTMWNNADVSHIVDCMVIGN